MGRAFEVRKQAMAKTAAAKTRVYSKYGKEIYMAAKGSPDPEINSDLRRIIDKAKKEQVPNDVIKRAIDKAKGGTDETYSLVRYEGFGPANSLFVVECLTDNPARTIANVRNCFTKSNSKLGVAGSVSHMFEYLAVFAIKNVTEDQILEVIIENDIEAKDIEEDSNGVSIYGEATDYNKIKTALLEYNENLEFVTDDVMWVAMQEVNVISEDDKLMFDKLTSMLDEVEDVKDVYHNAILE